MHHLPLRLALISCMRHTSSLSLIVLCILCSKWTNGTYFLKKLAPGASFAYFLTDIELQFLIFQSDAFSHPRLPSSTLSNITNFRMVWRPLVVVILLSLLSLSLGQEKKGTVEGFINADGTASFTKSEIEDTGRPKLLYVGDGSGDSIGDISKTMEIKVRKIMLPWQWRRMMT